MKTDLLVREKVLIGTLLAFVSLVAWVHTINQSLNMGASEGAMAGPMGPELSAESLLLFLVTWLVMMVAMMFPSVAPMILAFGSVSRKPRPGTGTQVSTAVFLFGYLLSWTALGVLAYALSQMLAGVELSFPTLRSYEVIGRSAVLIVAGVFQLSTWKYACLSQCRTPLGFIMSHWRDGKRGALSLGIQHGLYCIGCCWALMAVLLSVGMMNLAAMALLALVIYVEKVSARGILLGKIVGFALTVAGIVLVGQFFLAV
jgi:predicted metal-binding membrane protein